MRAALQLVLFFAKKFCLRFPLYKCPQQFSLFSQRMLNKFWLPLSALKRGKKLSIISVWAVPLVWKDSATVCPRGWSDSLFIIVYWWKQSHVTETISPAGAMLLTGNHFISLVTHILRAGREISTFNRQILVEFSFYLAINSRPDKSLHTDIAPAMLIVSLP